LNSICYVQNAIDTVAAIHTDVSASHVWISTGKERTQTFDVQIASSRIHFSVVAGVGSFASDRAVRITDWTPNTNVPGLSDFTGTLCAFDAVGSCTRFACCLSGLVGGGG